jgi:hypothetical protein
MGAIPLSPRSSLGWSEEYSWRQLIDADALADITMSFYIAHKAFANRVGFTSATIETFLALIAPERGNNVSLVCRRVGVG